MVTIVPVPAFAGIPGGPELLIIVGIAVLLFGANKIPKLARSMGEASGEFKKGRQELEEELEDVQQDVGDGVDTTTDSGRSKNTMVETE